jgi:primase-polymerase (primpol)-like protein
VPYQVGHRRASSTEPSTWATFEAVTNEWRRVPNWYAGPGFVFSPDDPFCGIDLDDSLDAEGNPKPWARGILERFSDTYMEISPSGAGLKIWVRGAVPANLAGVSADEPTPPPCPSADSGARRKGFREERENDSGVKAKRIPG